MSNNKGTSQAVRAVVLPTLKPSDYRTWVKVAASTFKINRLHNIVVGEESKPRLPVNETATPQQVKATEDWQRRQDLAENALLESVHETVPEAIEKSSNAKEIWDFLHARFANPSIMARLNAEQELVNLRKDPSTSMDEHIRKSLRIQHLVDANTPLSIPPMMAPAINLAFM